MSTALDLDIALLVGEMEAPPCESVSHRPDNTRHDGPASHYAKVWCDKCGDSCVKAYCQKFVDHIVADGLVLCSCGNLTPASQQVAILGPVGGKP